MPLQDVRQRVYRHLLRDAHTLGASNLGATVEMLASDLGIPNEQVADAVRELMVLGHIVSEDDGFVFYEEPQPRQPPSEPAPEQSKVRRRRVKRTSDTPSGDPLPGQSGGGTGRNTPRRC